MRPGSGPARGDRTISRREMAEQLREAKEAADQAILTHGGIGYTRHMPFEHIYRHHRRYRITEGSEEVQMRRIAQIMFGFGRPRA